MSRDFSKSPVAALLAVFHSEHDDPLATIYISRSTGAVIVCSMRTAEKGLYFEQDGPMCLGGDCSSEAMGQAIWEALLNFQASRGINLRSCKHSHWPAFQVSGMRSIRTFEEEYVKLSIRASPAILRIEAEVPQQTNASSLFVGAHIGNGCEFDALGESVKQVYRCRLQLAQRQG